MGMEAADQARLGIRKWADFEVIGLQDLEEHVKLTVVKLRKLELALKSKWLKLGAALEKKGSSEREHEDCQLVQQVLEESDVISVRDTSSIASTVSYGRRTNDVIASVAGPMTPIVRCPTSAKEAQSKERKIHLRRCKASRNKAR
eukprot:4818286-Amphidinium_carterae.1